MDGSISHNDMAYKIRWVGRLADIIIFVTVACLVREHSPLSFFLAISTLIVWFKMGGFEAWKIRKDK